jgi:Flp pilus assembly pilin Flp
MHIKQTIQRLWKEEEGQDLIEYALLVALIALATAAVFPPVATRLHERSNPVAIDLIGRARRREALPPDACLTDTAHLLPFIP